jgi:succinoglycan biosynthesis transport protein ExoP
LAYLVVVTPSYTSFTLISVDPGEATADALSATIQSHITTIGSNEVTSDVIDRLDLAADAEVRRGKLDRLVSGLRDWFGIEAREPLSEEEAREIVENQIASALDVQRVSDSRIIEVSYTADSPERAATIANTYAKAYVEGLVRRSRESTARRAEFLRSRAAEVEQLAVSGYQEAWQIRSRDRVDLGGLQNLNSRIAQLTEARSAVEEAEAAIMARLALMENTDDLEALKVAALQAEGGPELVAAYEEASGKLEQLRQRGAAQQLIAQLEASAKDLRRELDGLLSRTRSNLEQELAILSARRDSINGEFERALLQSSRRSWSEILIAEDQAGVFQNIYADHLRELEAVYGRAGAVPINVEARARPAVEPSWPDYKLVLMLAAVSGLVLGVAIVMLREWYASHRVPPLARAEKAPQ